MSEIKTECAVCTDCENYIGELDFAIRGTDGDILCGNCMKKYLDGDLAGALEWAQTAEIADGARFARKCCCDDRIVYPRGCETA